MLIEFDGQESTNNQSPFQNKSDQKEVDSDGRESIASQEGDQESKTNKDKTVSLMKNWKFVKLFRLEWSYFTLKIFYLL